MTSRLWDSYLTDQDRADIAAHPAPRDTPGFRPALLLVDLYRKAFGDEPEPLSVASENWPESCGLAGWQALPSIQRLLAAARERRIPVIHFTGLEGVPGWHDTHSHQRAHDAQSVDRWRRRYEIMDQVAPIEGEIVLGKTTPSAFNGTPLLNLLRGMDRDTVVVAGEVTSGCVRATVVDAKSFRFRVVVPEECVFDRHETSHAINLFDIDQKYGPVISMTEALAYLDTVPAEAPDMHVT